MLVLVTLRLNLSYTVTGTLLEKAVCSLPAGMPNPIRPPSVESDKHVINYGVGALSATRNNYSPGQSFSSIRLTNPGNNGNPDIFDIVIARGTGTYQYAYAIIQYFTTI